MNQPPAKTQRAIADRQPRRRGDRANRALAETQSAPDAVKTGADFATSVLTGHDPDRALELIAARAKDLTSAARASIATLQPDRKTLRVQEIDKSGMTRWTMSIPLEGSLFGQALTAASVVTTTQGEPRLILPLLASNFRGRAVELVRPGDAPPFSPEEARKLELFANAAAGTFSDREAADRRLAALMEVTQAILQGGDRQQILRLVVRRARELVGAAISAIYIPESDGHTLRCRVADGAIADDLMQMPVPIADSITGRTFTTGRAVNAPGLATEPGANVTFARMTDYGPTLFIPLAVGDRPVGVMTLGNVGGARPFSDEDLTVARTFAAQAAMCLGYAGVREGLQQLEAASAAEGRSLDETFATLAKNIVETTHSEAAAIFRLEHGRLGIMGSFGLPKNIVGVVDAADELRVIKGVWTAVRTRTFSIRKVQEVLDSMTGDAGDERVRLVGDFLRGASWETIVSVPLIYQGRVLGALTAMYAKGYQVDDTEVAFLKIVAGQAATTVENARLVALAQQKATLEERQRLARELHDSVSQVLYGIALATQTALDLLNKGSAALSDPLRYVQRLAEAGLAEMRALIFELRPESLEKEGLVAALRRQATLLRARYEIAVVEDLDDEPPLSLEAKETLFRIAQEAMQNIAKHSRATGVEVRLKSQESTLTLEIVDNGVGFDPSLDFPGHMGLRSIRERASALGSKVAFISAPGQGARVRVTVPVGPMAKAVESKSAPAVPVYRETFVREIAGFYEQLTSSGHSVETRVLRLERMVAAPALAERLRLRPGDPVVHVLRLRIVDDRPNHIAETFLRSDRFPQLESADLSRGSLYALLRERYRARLARSQVIVEASWASVEQATQLEIEPGAPLLLVKSTVHDPAGRPLLFAQSWHRAGASQVEFEVLASDG